MEISHLFEVKCFGPDGVLKWEDSFKNLVVTAGLNKYLDATLKTGLAAPAWYIGLKGVGTVVAADTMASHAGWNEITTYALNRKVWTPGTIANGQVGNGASPAVFTFTSASAIYGAFLCDEVTKGGATGTLIGAGNFVTNYDLIVNDTITVTVTVTLTGA